jgi:hypothetical protein
VVKESILLEYEAMSLGKWLLKFEKNICPFLKRSRGPIQSFEISGTADAESYPTRTDFLAKG